MPITKAMQEAIDMVRGAVGGRVYFTGGSALILSDDDTWIVRVSADGSTEEAYLSTEPMENLISVREDTYTIENLPDLQGFTTGFTC